MTTGLVNVTCHRIRLINSDSTKHVTSSMINTTKEQTSRVLSEIRNICKHCAASREPRDLKILHDFVNSNTEIVHDPLWKFLPQAQRIRLCAHFRHVKYEVNTLIYLDGPEVDLKLLVWGEAELVCGDHTLSLAAKLHNGPSLGGIRVPTSVQNLIEQSSPNFNPFDERGETCHDFTRRTVANSSDPKMPRPSALISRGSECLYLNSMDIRHFMERLFDRLISHRIFNQLHLNELRKTAQFYTIPPGHPIITEGSGGNKIVLTLRGKCELRKSLDSIKRASPDLFNCDPQWETRTEKKKHKEDSGVHIGYASPMSFVGFLPFVLRGTHDQAENDEDMWSQQPMAVIAETEVRCIVIEGDDFVRALKGVPFVSKIFKDLADKQMNWINNCLPRKVAMMLSEEEEEVEPFPNSSMVELENMISLALTKKPLLNKHRVLSKFKTLVSGEKDEEMDQFSQFQLDFSGLPMSKLLKNIQEDWNCDTRLLKPYPAIADRRYHGKTIPLVKQSNGFQSPFDENVCH